MRRVCDGCGSRLAGRKGHGFPVQAGKAIYCGSCAKGKK